MNWTPDKPTKPGWYWVRNIIANNYEQCGVQMVQLSDFGNGPSGNYDVFLVDEDISIELRGIISAEWLGPLEVPQ